MQRRNGLFLDLGPISIGVLIWWGFIELHACKMRTFLHIYLVRMCLWGICKKKKIIADILTGSVEKGRFREFGFGIMEQDEWTTGQEGGLFVITSWILKHLLILSYALFWESSTMAHPGFLWECWFHYDRNDIMIFQLYKIICSIIHKQK